MKVSEWVSEWVGFNAFTPTHYWFRKRVLQSITCTGTYKETRTTKTQNVKKKYKITEHDKGRHNEKNHLKTRIIRRAADSGLLRHPARKRILPIRWYIAGTRTGRFVFQIIQEQNLSQPRPRDYSVDGSAYSVTRQHFAERIARSRRCDILHCRPRCIIDTAVMQQTWPCDGSIDSVLRAV